MMDASRGNSWADTTQLKSKLVGVVPESIGDFQCFQWIGIQYLQQSASHFHITSQEFGCRPHRHCLRWNM